MEHKFEVFFDGDCPLCKREIDVLRRMDKAGEILFTDIAAEGFQVGDMGLTWDDLMARIHGRLPDGRIVEGVEVFRQLYGVVGFGWVVKVSRWPGVAGLLDGGYRIFAANRLRWTGRCVDGSCRVEKK